MDATIVTYKEFLAAATDIFQSTLFNLQSDNTVKAVMVAARPGTGKTFSARYIQKAIGFKARFMLKAGHHESYEFNGVPVADLVNLKAHMVPISSLLPPSDFVGGMLMTWDEVGDYERAVQNILCQGIFENGFHNYTFPNPTLHLLTTNRVADRSGANRIITKLGNRVAWFTLEPTKDEVFEYLVSTGGNPTVLAFLKLKGNEQINQNDRAKDGWTPPTYFNTFDPSDPAQAVSPIFASSRSIEFVSNLMNYIDATNPKIDNGALLTRVAGLVGTPWASAFVPFRSEVQVMPDPDDILSGKKIPYPKKESIMWALTIALQSRVVAKNWKHLDNYLKQGSFEYRALAIRNCFDTRIHQVTGPDFLATLQEEDVKQMLKAK